METILEEIIVHFRPEPEEELHSAVHALLIKCFQVLLSHDEKREGFGNYIHFHSKATCAVGLDEQNKFKHQLYRAFCMGKDIARKTKTC